MGSILILILKCESHSVVQQALACNLLRAEGKQEKPKYSFSAEAFPPAVYFVNTITEVQLLHLPN